MKIQFPLLFKIVPLISLILFNNSLAGEIIVKDNPVQKTIVLGNSKMQITLDYNKRCVITEIEINSSKVISKSDGVFSRIRTKEKEYTTLSLNESPVVSITNNEVAASKIIYNVDNINVSETWKFNITEEDIKFNVERNLSGPVEVEEMGMPSFNFDNINTWEGAFLGNGGVAWFYLFNERLCTYGVHTNYSCFWNSKTDLGLKINIESPGQQTAVKYTRSVDDKLEYNVTFSNDEMIPRYDEDTHRRRFIRGKDDVWSAFTLSHGTYRQTLTLTPFSYKEEYNRGSFKGINGEQVTSVLNTIARIGVIDSKLYGGNSWHTPYGPICLHEQYIAQFGIAINDSNYNNGYKECLDYYKDNAINSDGRVLPRWAYDNSDAMPGTATQKGFYEAQWGYLLDSNPDFVSNVSQLYNISGDIEWVKTQKESCEKALQYMLNRDSNGNSLVEMMTNSSSEKKGSDWIDIVWASYENAFVNAKLYYALILWADIEKQLGDMNKHTYYSSYAEKLKQSFNKSISEGGFWDEERKCYAYWRDKDNSIHGINFVVPVNLMAIAYNICDDEKRSRIILDKLEDQMQKENLFMWPICLFSFEKGEGRDDQFPFPVYENGDIFLSWGAVGVQAYAGYNPDIALKYIENILARHTVDGLAFQRYGRAKQDGLGDDILSGNFLAIAGLYQSIYGINPLYNRLYLNPHLPDKLNGTELLYDFRGEKLKISLSSGNYSVAGNNFSVTSNKDFGYSSNGNELNYFYSGNDTPSIRLISKVNDKISVEILKCGEEGYTWNQAPSSKGGKVIYTVYNLKAGHNYFVVVNGEKLKEIKSSSTSELSFEIETSNDIQTIEVMQ